MMNIYDREFLVPYLENVCVLQLLKFKTAEKYNEAVAKKRTNDCNINAKTVLPNYPYLEKMVTKERLLPLMFGLFMEFWILLGALTIPDTFSDPITIKVCWFLGIAGLVFAGIPIWLMVNTKKENDILIAAYEREEERAIQEAHMKREAAKKRAAELEDNVLYWKKKLDNVVELLASAYGANVIPRQYRDLYAAVYLYDWFSTGSSSDMDHALSMFVLEQIKDRLDKIIVNQAEQIMNQRIMMARQEQALRQQNDHNHKMDRLMGKLDQIQASDEERNKYLSMIETNTSVTAYFAAADYIRKIWR